MWVEDTLMWHQVKDEMVPAPAVGTVFSVIEQDPARVFLSICSPSGALTFLGLTPRVANNQGYPIGSVSSGGGSVSFSGCKATVSVLPVIPGHTDSVQIGFDIATIDQGGYFTSPPLISIPETGYYLIGLGIGQLNSTSDPGSLARYTLSSDMISGILGFEIYLNNGSEFANASVPFHMTAGDIIRLYVDTVDCIPDITVNPEVWITKYPEGSGGGGSSFAKVSRDHFWELHGALSQQKFYAIQPATAGDLYLQTVRMPNRPCGPKGDSSGRQSRILPMPANQSIWGACWDNERKNTRPESEKERLIILPNELE